MLSKPFNDLLKLLSGEGSPQGEVPPGVVEAAKKAGVLELLGREPAVRVNGINEAGNQKISKTASSHLRM